ncbi:MAG: M28 family peptidase [Gammaproteobacteria bacterium]|nr:M28 family peptidase [Gammaproteobacteria bacterium]
MSEPTGDTGGDPGNWGLPPAAAAAARAIDPRRIAAHVKFLSSDLLEGRGTGTRGGDIAAAYIASQFALDGLKPAGDGGGYLQKINFLGVATDPGATGFALVPDQGNAITLKYGDDYVTTDQTGATDRTIDAPIVFVGYGIHAPEYDWDDFKGVDVRGKVLLLFVNEPTGDAVPRSAGAGAGRRTQTTPPLADPPAPPAPTSLRSGSVSEPISGGPKFFDGPALTYYGRWTYKYEEAARRGAAGVLIIHRTDLASYPWSVVRNSWSGEQAFLADDPQPRLGAASWISWDVAGLLFTAAGKNIDDMFKTANSRSFKPIPLPVKLSARIVSKVRHFSSSNVLGLLPGRDPGPPRQVVIYSAHYDHLGIIPGAPGADDIYNGAVDNGTGVGVLLALAQAYANATERPPHPVLFASVTAEEKGLLGSDYLARHLPFPARDATLDLNFDALLPLGIPQSVTLTGARRTSFYPLVRRTAQAFAMSIDADANPGAGHYFRSDHFSFARVGVPAFSIGEGVKFADHPRQWGVERLDDYIAHRYHQPGDQFDPNWDFQGLAKIARFGFALGWLASTQPQPLQWKPGDAFGRMRQTAPAAAHTRR